MPRTDSCDVCGRTVTITTDRGEYVTGLQGWEYSDGTIRCEGATVGPDGMCATRKDGETVYLEG